MLTQLKAILFLILILGAQSTNLQMQKKHSHHKRPHKNLQVSQDQEVLTLGDDAEVSTEASETQFQVSETSDEPEFSINIIPQEPKVETFSDVVVEEEDQDLGFVKGDKQEKQEKQEKDQVSTTPESEFQKYAAAYYTFDNFYAAYTEKLQGDLKQLEGYLAEKTSQCSDLQSSIDDARAAIGKAEGYITWLEAELYKNWEKKEGIYAERCDAHQVFITYLHNAKITLRLTAFLKQAITNYTLAQVKQVGKIMKNFLNPRFLTNTDAVKQMLVQLQQVDGGEESIGDAIQNQEPVRSRTEEEIGTEHVDSNQEVLDLESYQASQEKNLDVYKQELIELLSGLEEIIDAEIGRRQDNEIELNEKVAEYVTKVETDILFSKYEIEREQETINQLTEFIAQSTLQAEMCVNDLAWLESVTTSQSDLVVSVLEGKAEAEQRYIQYWAVRPSLWSPESGKVYDLDNFDGFGLRVMSSYGEGRIDIGVNYQAGDVTVNSGIVKVDSKFSFTDFVDSLAPNSKDLTFGLLDDTFAGLVSADDKQVFKINLPSGGVCAEGGCGRYYLISTIQSEESDFSAVKYYNTKVYIGGAEFAYFNPQWISQEGQTAFIALELYYNLERQDWFVKPLNQAYTWGDLLNTDGSKPREVTSSGIQSKLSLFAGRAVPGSALSTSEWSEGDRAIHFINYNQETGVKLPQSLQSSFKVGFDWSGEFDLDFGVLAVDPTFRGGSFVDASQTLSQGMEQKTSGLTSQGDRIEIDLALNKVNSRYYFSSAIKEVSFESVEYLKWTIYSNEGNVFTFYQEQGKTNISAFESQSFVVFEVYQNSEDEGSWYLRFFNFWVDEDRDGGAFDTPFCAQVRRIIRAQAFTTLDISESGADVGYNLSQYTETTSEVRFSASNWSELRVDVYGTSADYSTILGGVKGDVDGNANASGSLTKVINVPEEGDVTDYWSVNLENVPQSVGSLFFTVQYFGSGSFADVLLLQFEVTNDWEVYYTKEVSPLSDEQSADKNYYIALEFYRNADDLNRWYVRNRNVYVLTETHELDDTEAVQAIHRLNPANIPASVTVEGFSGKHEPNPVEEGGEDISGKQEPSVDVVPQSVTTTDGDEQVDTGKQELSVDVAPESVTTTDGDDQVDTGKWDPESGVTYDIRNFQKGIKLPSASYTGLDLGFAWETPTADLDGGLLLTDSDYVVQEKFYWNNEEIINGLSSTGDARSGEQAGDDESITINLEELDSYVSHMFVVVSIYDDDVYFGDVTKTKFTIYVFGKVFTFYQIDPSDPATSENSTVIIAEFFRNTDDNNSWYLRTRNQWFLYKEDGVEEVRDANEDVLDAWILSLGGGDFARQQIVQADSQQQEQQQQQKQQAPNPEYGVQIPKSENNNVIEFYMTQVLSSEIQVQSFVLGAVQDDDHYIIHDVLPGDHVSSEDQSIKYKLDGDQQVFGINLGTLQDSSLFFGYIVENNSSYLSVEDQFSIQIKIGGVQHINFHLDAPENNNQSLLIALRLWYNVQDGFYYLKKLTQYSTNCHGHNSECLANIFNPNAVTSSEVDQWTPEDNVQYNLKNFGQGIKIPSYAQGGLDLGFAWETKSADLDGALLVADDDYVVWDRVYWNNKASISGLKYSGDARSGEAAGDDETITVNFDGLAPWVSHLFVVVSVYDDGLFFSDVSKTQITVYVGGQVFTFYTIDPSDPSTSGNTSAVIGEFFKNPNDNDSWYLKSRNNWFLHNEDDGSEIRDCNETGLDAWAYSLNQYSADSLASDHWGPSSGVAYNLQVGQSIKLPQRLIQQQSTVVGFKWNDDEAEIDLDGSIIMADSTFGVTEIVDYNIEYSDDGSVYQYYGGSDFGDNETMVIRFQDLDLDIEHLFPIVTIYDDGYYFDEVYELQTNVYIGGVLFATVRGDPSDVGSGKSAVITAEFYQNEDDDFNWYLKARQDWFLEDSYGDEIREPQNEYVETFVEDLEYDI